MDPSEYRQSVQGWTHLRCVISLYHFTLDIVFSMVTQIKNYSCTYTRTSDNPRLMTSKMVPNELHIRLDEPYVAFSF